ncbi:MAG TPA: hypothetical protein VFB12_02230 [Ktedonobacteraceae bacterium]|nr:hypothetical protein [Ktedonobacteraceae bacterium]
MQGHILVIDHQAYWRQFSTDALSAAGYSVETLDTYTYLPPREKTSAEKKMPDLVVLGCARVGPEEQELIALALTNRYHLLVLCSFLPWQEMRALFLQGVDDVVDKPYTSKYLVRIVKDAMEHVERGCFYNKNRGEA